MIIIHHTNKKSTWGHVAIIWVIALAALVIYGLLSVQADAANVETPSKFDTSILETWCGEPVGTIRMVGAWPVDSDTFEDETGNLWGWDNLEDGFYLLWIDDMGTQDIKDDEIVKIFQEKP